MKTSKSLEKLLASFGPNALKTGSHLLHTNDQHQQRPLFFTHVEAFDELNGGLRRGTLIEVVGAGSSGRFSLELAALAAATNAGETAALIDLGDHFDPKGANDAGVDLEKLFWLRPQKFSDALKSTEIVLTAGFRFVVLDLGVKPILKPQTTEAVWMRLAREAKSHDSLVFVITPTSIGSSAADATIETANLGSAWLDAQSPWRLLDGLTVGLTVLRQRGTFERKKKRSRSR